MSASATRPPRRRHRPLAVDAVRFRYAGRLARAARATPDGDPGRGVPRPRSAERLDSYLPRKAGLGRMSTWELSSSSARGALDIVDGTGAYSSYGPHYSRRTPGSKTFTGVGQEVVLVHPSGAVWAVVYQRVPAPRGSGASRGRAGVAAPTAYVWRNMMFRNLGAERSSELIRQAVAFTARAWIAKYGLLPSEDLRTEIKASAVRSEIPGYSYRRAGWVRISKSPKGMVYLRCPRAQIERSFRDDV